MENLFRINPEYKGEPKPKKEEEDLVLEFKEPEKNESPADSKKFVHYESPEDLLEKQAQEAYSEYSKNKSEDSLSEKSYKRLWKSKRKLELLKLNSDKSIHLIPHPELKGRTKEGLEEILSRHSDKGYYSSPSLMNEFVHIFEEEFGEKF